MTDDELDVAARTLWGEIRNGNTAQKTGVAWVIRNRVDNPRWWGRDIAGVCRREHKGVHQFSCWNEGDPNRAKMEAVTDDDLAFVDCKAVLRLVFGGMAEDPTNGADHYCTLASKPWWAKDNEPVHQDGKHKFYRLEL